jgi:hypothetical protein
MKPIALVLLAWTFAVAGGCTRYGYQVVEPSEFAGQVATHERDGELSLDVPPLRYVLNAMESRLVIRIFNDGSKPVTLVGGQSAAVDLASESRPLPTTPIAPQSFAKLILPPPRPVVEPRGPNISIGVMGGFGSVEPEAAPIYLQSRGSDEWAWSGEGRIRLRLVYDAEAGRFEHAVVLDRVKLR